MNDTDTAARAIVAATLARAIDPLKCVYIADNSRYRPDAHILRGRIDALCREHGLRPLWPFAHALFPTDVPPWQRRAVGIPEEDDPANVNLLRKAPRVEIGEDSHAIIAELSPFQGPHCNPVIALEIGMALASGRKVFAWTAAFSRPAEGGAEDACAPWSPLTLRHRIHTGCRPGADGYWRDGHGNRVENFELIEEAEIAGNIVSLSASIEGAIRVCAAHFAARNGNPIG